MNKSRRNQISEQQVAVADLVTQAEAIKESLENIRDEEQDAYDNLPESIQNGERGEASQAAIEALDEAIAAMDDVIGADVEGALDRAAE